MAVMLRSTRLLPLLLAVIFACSQSAPEKVAVVLQGDAAGTRVVQQIVDRDPRIADPQSNKEFFIQIVKPDPKIDYKIVQIQTDPNVKYFLRVLDREGKDTDAAVNSKLSAALQAKVDAAGSDPK